MCLFYLQSKIIKLGDLQAAQLLAAAKGKWHFSSAAGSREEP
jgi:hypothetical protein